MLRGLVAKLFLFTLMFSVSVRCSHSQKQFEADLDAGRCDEAMSHLPQAHPVTTAATGAQRAVGTLAYYTFVGASYLAEVAWDVTAGTVAFVVVCSGPLLQALATVYAHNNSSYSDRSILPCFVEPGSAIEYVSSPPLGRIAFERNVGLTCPSLAGLSRSLRTVSGCYARKNDFERAAANLENLKKSTEIYNCLPPSEREAINQQLDETARQRALKNLPASVTNI